MSTKNGQVIFDGKSCFGLHFSIFVSNAVLRVGNNMNCNNSSVILCVDGIVLGENVLVGGWLCYYKRL